MPGLQKRPAHRPAHPDACGHNRPRDRFLGTVAANGRAVDVYVYQDNALGEPPIMHLCLRYARRACAYASPGDVGDFVQRWTGRADAPPEYRAALPLVIAWLAGSAESAH